MNTPEQRISELEADFRNLGKQLEGISLDVKKVLEVASQLTLQMNSLNERYNSQSLDIDRAFTEIRELKIHDRESEKDYEDERKQIRQSVQEMQSKVTADISGVKTEVSNNLAAGRAAWKTASILWGIIQFIVLAACGFVFQMILSNQELNITQEQRLLLIEKQIESVNKDHARHDP